MRLAYMGTPEFAVPALDALHRDGHEIVAVYTQPARPAGRGKAVRPSPVQQRAEELGIEIRTPASLKEKGEQETFAALDLDFAVVAAYGLILPKRILDAPKGGCLNIHASLLPRWRGAAPIQRAILAGDQITGITIMKMDKGLDTGPMMANWPATIDRKTAGELTAELAQVGAELIVSVFQKMLGAGVGQIAQPERSVTYATKIAKHEAKLDFSQPAFQVERQVRAFNPSPGAYFEHGGERIKVLAAEISELSGEPGTVLDHGLAIACGEGSIVPTEVKRAGRAAMRPDELLRGFVIPVGTKLA
jgi:methionyl-tRNA formyltransferase